MMQIAFYCLYVLNALPLINDILSIPSAGVVCGDPRLVLSSLRQGGRHTREEKCNRLERLSMIVEPVRVVLCDVCVVVYIVGEIGCARERK